MYIPAADLQCTCTYMYLKFTDREYVRKLFQHHEKIFTGTNDIIVLCSKKQTSLLTSVNL